MCIQCPKTGFSAEIEFKLKPLLGGVDASNAIEGKIKFAKDTLAVMRGKWDSEIMLEERKSIDAEPVVTVLWSPSQDVIENRLKRYVVPIDHQREFESERYFCSLFSYLIRIEFRDKEGVIFNCSPILK